MARNRLKKRKFGGSGTRVGNTIRSIVNPIKSSDAFNTASNVFSKVRPILNPVLPKIGFTSTVINSLNRPSQIPKGTQVFPENKSGMDAYRFEQQLSQPGMPDSGLFRNTATTKKINAIQDTGKVLGQNTVSGDGEVITPDGRSYGMGGQPVVDVVDGNNVPFRNQTQYDNSQINKPQDTPSVPEFMRAGVSGVGATSGAGLGGETGGGARLGFIPGTQIEDPVLKNLLEQYGKDAQLAPDLNEIRDRNRTNVQAEIDAINAVYSDLVGRAIRTGKEAEGSERALQARSGTLPSSFGQGAMQTQAENTNKNVGEIENQRTQAISEIYSRSEARAMDEFTKLQNLRTSGIEGYIQAMELQKESMDKGLDETAQYIALSGMTGDDLGIDGLEKLAKDWNTTPMAVYNRIAEKKSLLDNSVIERAKAMKDAGMGTETNMGSDFDYFSKESIAMSVLPTQLRNSDKEQEYYREGIRQGLEAGMDPYDIADVLMGFNVTNKDEFTSSVRQLIGQSELSQNKIADVARNINAGNYSNALSIVENSIMARAKKETDSFVSESTTKTALQRSSELENKINGLEKSPIGVTSGTMENWLGRLRGKDASKIKADIVRQVAQMRKEFSGSAVTPSEEKFLAPIIPDLADKPDVFMYKLQALGSEPLRQLNNIRQQYGMIPLDEESLADKNIRVEDYYSIGGDMQQNTQQQEVGNFNW